MLPKEMGCGSGSTCWRRLVRWQRAGSGGGCTRCCSPSCGSGPIGSDACPRRQRLRPGAARGKKTGPNPTDRRKAGSKHHILTEARGIPLTAMVTGANRHDVTQICRWSTRIPPLRGCPGRPVRKPGLIQGDRGYDSQPHRDACIAAASGPSSPSAGHRTAAGWAARAGSSNGRWRGSIGFAASTCAMNVGRVSTRRSSCSAVP